MLIERLVCRILESDLSWAGIGWLRPKAADQAIRAAALLQIVLVTGFPAILLTYIACRAAIAMAPEAGLLRGYVIHAVAGAFVLNAALQAAAVALWNRRARRLLRRAAEPTSLVLLLAALLAGAATADAQLQVGGRVVLASPEVPLKIGRRLVAAGPVHRVYQVEIERGDWLWITADEVAGWVKRAQLIPFDQALADATEAIQSGGKTPVAYLRRGLLLADRGRTDLAIADYTEAIRIDPGYAAAYLNRGLAHQSRGDFQAAESDLSKAVIRAPVDTLAHYNRGVVRLGLRNYAGARDDFNLAVECEPTNAAAWFNHAATSLIVGESAEAAADAQIYLRLAGWKESLSPYAVLIGWAGATRAGETALAEDLARQGLEQCDPNVFAHQMIQYAAGKKELEPLLADAPSEDQEAEARLYAAIRLESQGGREAAAAHYRWIAAHADRGRIPFALAEAALRLRVGG